MNRYLAAFGFLVCLTSCRLAGGRRYDVARVERRDIVLMLSVRGSFQTSSTIPVFSPVTAQVKEILVQPGTPVEAAQVLLTFQEPQPSETPLRQAWVPEIRAPLRGVVRAVNVIPGSIVLGEGEASLASTPVTLSQDSEPSLRIPLRPTEAQRIEAGMPATVYYSDGSSQETMVQSVSPQEREAVLGPGVGRASDPTVLVRVVLAREDDVLAVPVQAIRVNEGHPSVLSVRHRGPVPVETGISDGHWVAVKKGLQEKDEVRIQP
jgi:multidrug efflux pump subunit AcrA (membrane-fusion protein)